MVQNNPDLIPLPSIGESETSRSTPVLAKPKKSKLWIVVLLCVVVGIALGVFVYQQSIAPTPTPSSRPTAAPAIPTPTANPSPVAPEVSAVTPQSNTIVFPKAGDVRVYFSTFDAANPTILNQLIRLTGPSGSADILVPGSIPSADKMATLNTGLTVAAGQSIKVEIFDSGDETKPSYGWIKPDASNQCGGAGFGKASAAALITWATGKAAGEPLVSTQCWGDWGPPGDTSNADFNDFFVILSYVPASLTSPAPSASPAVSPAASPSPNPSPSPVLSPSPNPSPSPALSPSPNPSVAASASETPTPSPRVTMPEGSTLPTAGVFEVTVGTVGVGLLFVALGILGLLLL